MAPFRVRDQSTARGAVLVIVVGMSSMLISLSIVFLLQMRSGIEATRVIKDDSQCRMMLAAALCYIQESSRLGWTDPAAPTVGQLAFGWTDVRDGSLGPRVRRRSTGVIPDPGWYRGKSLADVDGNPNNEFTLTDPMLPVPGQRIWPCPGSALRVDCFAYQRTPYALRMETNFNPMTPDPNDNSWKSSIVFDPVWASKLGATVATKWLRSGSEGYASLPPPPGSSIMATTYSQAWVPYNKDVYYNGYGSLSSQPVSSTWNEFKAGDLTPSPTSQNLGWFRIYREMPSDKDNDGAPWYDRVPLQNSHGVFIIACGSGATRGFRWWGDEPDYDPDLEPISASASGVFGSDKSLFTELRRTQRILFFRVEWTAAMGGEGNIAQRYMWPNNTSSGNWMMMGLLTSINGQRYNTSNDEFDSYAYWSNDNYQPYAFGTIKWIQRLEREPPKW